jgi:hypothetical protein
MAKVSNDSVLNGLSGAIGKRIVFKQYGEKTIVTSYPDMSKVKPSMPQKENRKVFKEAVAYAKSISADPEKKRLLAQKLPKGESVYRFALKEYLLLHKR